MARHGGANKPIFITEFGISTDNGRCLSDNYGWPTCLTYSQAATDLHNAIVDLHNSYPTLAELFIFAQRDMKSSGSTSDREGYFGALQSMGGSKGAFTDTRSATTSTPSAASRGGVNQQPTRQQHRGGPHPQPSMEPGAGRT